MLGWLEGHFDLEHRRVEREAVIERAVRQLLEAGARHGAEFNRLARQLPAMRARMAVDHPRLAERMREVPDSLAALIALFDGERSLEQAMDESPFDDISTLQTVLKLYQEELLHVVDVPPASRMPSSRTASTRPSEPSLPFAPAPQDSSPQDSSPQGPALRRAAAEVDAALLAAPSPPTVASHAASESDAGGTPLQQAHDDEHTLLGVAPPAVDADDGPAASDDFSDSVRTDMLPPKPGPPTAGQPVQGSPSRPRPLPPLESTLVGVQLPTEADAQLGTGAAPNELVAVQAAHVLEESPPPSELSALTAGDEEELDWDLSSRPPPGPGAEDGSLTPTRPLGTRRRASGGKRASAVSVAEAEAAVMRSKGTQLLATPKAAQSSPPEALAPDAAPADDPVDPHDAALPEDAALRDEPPPPDLGPDHQPDVPEERTLPAVAAAVGDAGAFEEPISEPPELGESGISATFFDSTPIHSDSMLPHSSEPLPPSVTGEQLANRQRTLKVMVPVLALLALLTVVALAKRGSEGTTADAREAQRSVSGHGNDSAPATGSATAASRTSDAQGASGQGGAAQGDSDADGDEARGEAGQGGAAESSRSAAQGGASADDAGGGDDDEGDEGDDDAAEPAADVDDPMKEAKALVNQGKWKEAIPMAKAAIRKQPGDANGYLYLGSAYQMLGKPKQERAAYDACATYADKGPTHYCISMGGRKQSD
jgi:hypothetical protein